MSLLFGMHRLRPAVGFIRSAIREGALLGGLLLVVSACNREEINARQQSGVWQIKRVTATMYNDTTGAVQQTLTADNAGQVAFVNINGQAGSTNGEARFYIDKDVPSRQLAALQGSTSSTVSAPSTIVNEWIVDKHDRKRITMRAVTDNPFLALSAVIFTITDESGNTQHWQAVRGNTAGTHIVYREEWEVEREQ